MNISLLDELACPSSLTGTRCLGKLQLAALPQPRFDPAKPDELIESRLECQECGISYLVLCGVAILIPDTNTYLQRSYKDILSLALEHGISISPEMLTHLHKVGAHIEPSTRNTPGEDNPRAISSYLRAHYDTGASLSGKNLPPNHPLLDFFQAYHEKDLYHVLLSMFATYLPKSAKIIDIGCHVGRLTRDLAEQEHSVLGIDTSFAAVFLARRAVRGWPTQLNEYEYFRDGNRREMRKLNLPPLNKGEVLVASAMQLPFRPETFQAAISANVIDILPDPIAYLREMRTVLRDGGIMGISTPYHSGASQAAARWLGANSHMDASQALRWRIGHHFEIIEEQDLVPWVLSEHERRFQIYLNHCIIARKSASVVKK
jgi:SAM-dependent methyltransferase